MKTVQSTMTEPGPLPDGIGPDEKWIDVNVTRQTLVMFEGNRPVFATLVSTGKKGATKKTDHSTVLGSFRIREKHVAATMDGDGALPGDAPYSIQDVPYVMYFKGSYALHGAFWHANFGNKMSHGCVNLSPLDSKRVFLWAEPNLPQGWHGAWASKDHPGSLVVVHE
jgi:lipoprotein-anchoring transpeptidase ErfK/SrfK